MKWLSSSHDFYQQKRKREGKGSCPRCFKEHDTLEHCLRCPVARPKLAPLLDNFYSNLEDRGTDPYLVEGIRTCTNAWLDYTLLYLLSDELASLPPVYFDFFHHIYSFDWFYFLQGVHTTCITDIQSEYFAASRSCRSVDCWHGRLINDLWYILEHMFYDRCDMLKIASARFVETHEAVAPALAAAKREWTLGLRKISVLYHQYFTKYTLSSLESLSVYKLKEWLRVVRLNRELSGYCQTPPDDFCPEGKFRAWLLDTSY